MLQVSAPVLPLVDSALAAPDAWSASPLAHAISRTSPVLVDQATVRSVGVKAFGRTPYLVRLAADATYAEAIELLDGAAEAVVIEAGSPLLAEFDPAVLTARVILSVQGDVASSGVSADNCGGVIIRLPVGATIDASVESVKAYMAAIQARETGRPTYVQLKTGAAPDIATVRVLSRMGAAAVISTAQLSVDGSFGLDYIDAFLSGLVSDRADGLFPTLVVSDTCSASLGLVYSSRESIKASLVSGLAHYNSRRRGLWLKGESSGATQRVVSVRIDCDNDAVEFRVEQHSNAQFAGFCHLSEREACFGSLGGLAKLEQTLRQRKDSAPPGSYTARLFNDEQLLGAKIREEAGELVEARDPEHVAFEAADLIYFALAKCVSAGVGLADIEHSLDRKSKRVTRRKGDAKPGAIPAAAAAAAAAADKPAAEKSAPAPLPADAPIVLPRHRLAETDAETQKTLLKRPAIRTEAILERVRPIITAVKQRGDAALLEYTAQFDRVQLESPVRLPPFQSDADREEMPAHVREAIDVAYANILRFHSAQGHVSEAIAAKPDAPSVSWAPGGSSEVIDIETMPGVVCSRFPRPIERVGIYVPGGSAVLPSTALMLGVPAQVAGCRTIVLATPPRADGTIAPEVLYVADKVGVSAIVCAGGAQAVAAMAYGTESVPKVDKIAGPGNQYVTCAKMVVQNDVAASVSIDMPAGPSEVLVIADDGANPAFVASDLLSQAEHGPDSQVVLVGIALTEEKLAAIEAEVDAQARRLPRVDVVRQAVDKSVTMLVDTREEALEWSNRYAPEHLILHTESPEALVPLVENAGSVFVGPWSPESCGDYASGTNHTLPTYGYARQYSGVSTSTFQKHITAQTLDARGLAALGPHVVTLAECEGLEAHANAVRVRLEAIAQEK
ncbi:trifunctional histidinol dehydrogenase [Malassezia cuniculi]|uniref:Histidine biosynthesis trifunctional protein n=1 Tax=Malassezia cuniculi TaxID=948313 RepID=A0AAF0EUY2_9BASI|nr:trifunctional histidinol dehydrogenase [Malassezia cuniculi]